MKRFLYWQTRLALKPFLAPWVPIGVQRAWANVAALSTRGPAGVATAPATLGGVPGLKLVPAGAQPGKALLFLHGGAYVIGGPRSHANLAAQLAHHTRRTTWLVDYRLAPEHPFPAALDDALAAYQALLAQGTRPSDAVVAGDSAGAGLALALAMALRDRALPLPAALALISPWTDLTLSGPSYADKAASDPMLSVAWLRACAAHYANGRPLDEPGVSPGFGSLAGLPPMLIQVGSEEILLSDAEALARRAGEAGVRATLRRYDTLWHEFQALAGWLPEADAALAEIGAFTEAAHG